MAKPQVRIYTESGIFIDREMNDEEYEQHLLDLAKSKQIDAIEKARIAKRKEALAKLEALGLDEEDLKALGL